MKNVSSLSVSILCKEQFKSAFLNASELIAGGNSKLQEVPLTQIYCGPRLQMYWSQAFVTSC